MDIHKPMKHKPRKIEMENLEPNTKPIDTRMQNHILEQALMQLFNYVDEWQAQVAGFNFLVLLGPPNGLCIASSYLSFVNLTSRDKHAVGPVRERAFSFFLTDLQEFYLFFFLTQCETRNEETVFFFPKIRGEKKRERERER